MLRLRPLPGPCLAVILTGCGWLHWRTPGSLGLLLLATTLLLLALLSPRAFAPVQRALETIGRLVATGFTWLILLLLFVGIFVPARLALALLGRDPLHRRPDPHRATYWEPLPPTAGLGHFRRQY